MFLLVFKLLIFAFMKDHILTALIGILALGACHYNGGEAPTPPEGSIVVASRLSNQRVNCITEDAQGLIWMGTLRGLNCFDGHEFIQFFCTDDETGLPDNQINAVHALQDGRLCVSTVNGVAFTTNQGNFHRVPVEDGNRNLSIILEEDEKLRPIRYDLLSDAIELTGDLPWRKISRGGKGWRDADDAHLMNYVETYYGAFSPGHYGPALARAADSRAFHPVRDYIESLPEWDGTPRLETLLPDYLGAEDSPYVRAVTRLTLQAALWRAFHPGTKFDNILVLCGPQGIGKSTLIARLGGPWYSDSLTLLDMNDKTAAEKLQGAWLVEIGEMAGMRKAEIEKVKAFLSRQDDRYRAAYGRRVVSHPRQCVFFGTTNNEGGYLRDVTGNRRFWTVPVTGRSPKKPWDLDPETVGQIWMEAVIRLDGGPLVLPPELERVSETIQREALEQDDRQGAQDHHQGDDHEGEAEARVQESAGAADGRQGGDERHTGVAAQVVEAAGIRPLEHPVVDNLLAVQFFAQLLDLLLHLEESFIVRFHSYCIFLSCSLIRTRRTETFFGEMPTIWPISS